ncbi:proteasome activator [Actinomadura sp. 7K507]|uniref:proteasome activator n=1 Tax=Actinomadura sp. 7K507 TaxID=2530365 RepID=UPI001404C1A6|nr:proteasome activator [Actinomadura sp. 7K507]
MTVVIGQGHEARSKGYGVTAPTRLMRTWRMLTAVNEELHSGIADDAAVHRAAMVFNVLRKEAISSLSPSLADEVRKLLPPLAEDSDLADTRVACASALGWLDSLMTSMLMQLAGQSEPVGGGGVRRPPRR